MIIQGDLGGKVSILGWDNIGYCKEEKSDCEHVPNSERILRWRCLNLHIHQYC